ncbi:MAG: carbohydrate porin [Ignavibacterium sp.]|nr:MAG: carbohydrate porin [Ignavibacterium sp.]
MYYRKFHLTKNIQILLAFICIILNQSNLAQSEEVQGDKIFKFQNKLLTNGIDFSANYVGEYFSNLSGGLQNNGTYLDNIIFSFEFDMNKLAGIEGMSIYLSGIGINGGIPLENTGALQGISNIAAVNQFKLFEGWIEQNLFDDNIAILLGLYNLNSEFDVRESSGIFLNPSFGIGFDFAQSGQNGPSIFPYTSLALRLKVGLSETFELIAAMFDGVPGSLANEKGLHLDLKKDEGALLSTELIFSPGQKEFGKDYSKFSIGGWYYTSDFEKTSDGTIQNGNYGVYVSAEQFVYSEKSLPEQGLAIFGRFGIANSNFNPSNYSFLGGLNYTGLIPGRDEDVLGFAFTSIHLTDEFRASENLESNYETILELTYSFQALNWLRFQPDLQCVFNPVIASSQSDYAFTAGMRVEIAL